MGPARRMVTAAAAAVVAGALGAGAATAQTPVGPPPARIALGADGNVWFTEFAAGRIGRITPTGAIREFPAAAGASWIALGPTGDLWVTLGYQGESMGRLTRAGRVIGYSDGLYPHGSCCGDTEVGVGPLVPGPGGDMWFTEMNGVGRISPAGAITLYHRSFAGSFPYAIAQAPDGTMWFAQLPWSPTRDRRGAVGTISPTGAVTRFSAGITRPLGPAWPGPHRSDADDGPPQARSLVAGPDGDMWFTQVGGIARVTPRGEITEYGGDALAGATVMDLVAGPDGNVWFAASRWAPGGRRPLQAVGRVTPAGDVTLFPTRLTPRALVVGADGAVWFTERAPRRAVPRIGRLTPAGRVTYFSAGITEGRTPLALAAGPDGGIWFTESIEGVFRHWARPVGAVGRITPDGVVTEFPAAARIVSVARVGTRAVAVRLACPPTAAGPCRGEVRLRRGWRLVAAARPVGIAPGRRAAVTVPLPGRWQRALRERSGRVAFSVVMRPRLHSMMAASTRPVVFSGRR